MHVETTVDETTAARLARAAVRDRLVRPPFWIPIVVELAVAAAFVATGHPGWALVVAVVAASLPVVLLTSSRSLTTALRRRAFRPGTVLAVDWAAEEFTVSSGADSTVYRYADVAAARVVGDAVVVRLRRSRVLLLLPAELVPDAVRGRLRGDP